MLTLLVWGPHFGNHWVRTIKNNLALCQSGVTYLLLLGSPEEQCGRWWRAGVLPLLELNVWGTSTGSPDPQARWVNNGTPGDKRGSVHVPVRCPSGSWELSLVSGNSGVRVLS